MHRFLLAVLGYCLTTGWLVAPSWGPVSFAAEPGTAIYDVFTDGLTSQDARWGELKTLNGHFPFQVPQSVEAWEDRAEQLRRRILVSGGIWPLPERTPLNAVLHGRVERDGFSVERVYFESVPGNYVTGLLFRPTGDTATKKPAVLCPHGHGGRLDDRGEQGVRNAIAAGFERFEQSGRFPTLARCAQLARMGCVTFFYDMIGYADNQQIPFEIAHRAANRRPEMEGREAWGFYSPMAESRLQSIMGLQSWNSIRALDFLASLPDVDPARIAVTGNSGGGTQTLLLCAIDERPIASFPNGMVSTSMQGGCYCENAPLLRVGTGNVELTALFAPKPMAMTAVDDWTRDMMRDGYPELKQLYSMYGKPDHVLCKEYAHFPHNYNYVTRALMYSFFNRHLGLGLPEPVLEADYEILTREETSVWNEQHPAPAGGPELERKVCQEMAARSDAQLAALREQDFDKYQDTVMAAYQTIIDRQLPPAGSVEFAPAATASIADVLVEKGTIELPQHGEQIPTLLIRRLEDRKPQGVVIMLSGFSKANLFGDDGKPVEAVRQAIDQGRWVVGIDLFAAGENLKAGVDPTLQRRVAGDDRHYVGFTYGYNPPRFVRRVHDILSVIRFASDRGEGTPLELVANNGAGPAAAVARLLVGDVVETAVIDTEGFRFADLDSIWHSQLLPGAVKYGDLPAVLALQAPHKLTIKGETGQSLKPIVQAYRQAADRLAVEVDK